MGVWALEAQIVLVHPVVLVLELGSQPGHVGQEELLTCRVMSLSVWAGKQMGQ